MRQLPGAGECSAARMLQKSSAKVLRFSRMTDEASSDVPRFDSLRLLFVKESS